MTSPLAIVVHADESTRRLISRALSVFTPTHRVVTTSTLSSATEWIATLEPAVVFLMGDEEHHEASMGWIRHCGVDPSRVLLIGANGSDPGTDDPLRIPEPVGLATLIAAVRASSARSGEKHSTRP